MSFKDDFEEQRRLLPQVIDICGAQLARRMWTEAPPEDDMERNTDLMVLKHNDARIAVRLRSYEYHLRYPDEFTIRSGRPSGVKTELTKIIEGWGTYNFYGFKSHDKTSIHAWVIGDLNIFRRWHSQELWRGDIPGTLQRNGPPDHAEFRAYTISCLPHDFIVARHAPKSQDGIWDEVY